MKISLIIILCLEIITKIVFIICCLKEEQKDLKRTIENLKISMERYKNEN